MRKNRKVLAAVLGMAMLLGSISAMAAGMPSTSSKDNPTWGDVWAIETYIEEQIWQYDQPGHVEMTWYNSEYCKEDAMKYEEPGRRLADSDKADQYGSIDRLYENPGLVDDNTQLENDLKDNYGNLYDAAVELVDSIVFATGECYNIGEFWDKWGMLWEQTEEFFDKIDSGGIQVVGSADDPESGAIPKEGEWIYFSALHDFDQKLQALDTIGKTFDNNTTTAELQAAVNEFENAIRKLIDPANGKFTSPFGGSIQSSSTPSKSSKSKDAPTVNVHEHQFEDVILQEATAYQDGRVGRQCVICGAVEPGSMARVSAYAVFIKDTVTAIEKASGAELTINTDRWVSFDKSVLDALAKKPGLALTINYVYNHRKYTVTVPAGADVSKLCNEEGFCGFRYLDAQFGGKELTK